MINKALFALMYTLPFYPICTKFYKILFWMKLKCTKEDIEHCNSYYLTIHLRIWLPSISDTIALVPALRAGYTTVWEQNFKHLRHSCLTACTLKPHERYPTLIELTWSMQVLHQNCSGLYNHTTFKTPVLMWSQFSSIKQERPL